MRRVLRLVPDIVLSVSVTTRHPRRGERDGVDYFFVSDGEFDRMAEAGELLEWAEIYGHRSGTPARFLAETRDRGSDVLLEIDVQGAGWARKREPNAVLVFLSPPSAEELRRRLRERGTEDADGLARRLEKAEWETAQAAWFDHVVVNDDADRAAAEVAAIIRASRHPTARHPTEGSTPP